MKKYFGLSMVLSLAMFTQSSFAAGLIDLAIMPLEQLTRHLKNTYKLVDADAETLAGTILRGSEYALGRNIPANAGELQKLLDMPGNEQLKAVFASFNVTKLSDLSEQQIGDIANRIGGVVDSSARSVADVCRSCGISENLLRRFGLKLYIPKDVDTSGLDTLANARIPLELHKITEAIGKEGRFTTARGKKVKISKSDIDALMQKQELNKHDLRKLLYAIRARSGSFGKEAQNASTEFFKAAGDDPIANNRLALIVADFNDNQEGKELLGQLAEETRRINNDKSLKSPADKSKALCEHFKGLAKGNPARTANFKQLKSCPNYAQVFNACEL